MALKGLQKSKFITNKNKQPLYKMKFAAYIALVASVGAIRLRQDTTTATSTHQPEQPPQDTNGPNAMDIIMRCDKNWDMMLTMEEGLNCIAEARKADTDRWDHLSGWVKEHAGKFDADGNQMLDEMELQAGMNAYFQAVNAREESIQKAEGAIAYCDQDGDGELTKEEGLACLKVAKEQAAIHDPSRVEQYEKIEADLKANFDAADHNGNGKLDVGELAKKIVQEGYWVYKS